MRRTRESGQVLPMVALMLAVLMGFGGMGVDVGFWEYSVRQQQNATDAAALGGAQALLSGGCPNQSIATTAAQNDASRNGYTNGSNVTVAVSNPPASGSMASNSCAVYVQITKSNVAAFFTRLFGKAAGVPETTEATAVVDADNDGCIYMLATNQNTNFHGGNIQAPKCDIYLNGTANFNGGSVDAAAIGEANYSGSNNGGTFSEASPKSMPPIADPCPEISGCQYLSNNPPSTAPCNGTYGGSGVLQPGCYNNLSLNKATVTLQPGLYVFAGSTNFNKASITANNVTIYIPSGATAPNFNNLTSLTLSPPTAGDYAGIAYYQAPGNSSNINLNGSNSNVSGVIYAPSASMNYNGSLGGYTVIVAAYANFNDSTGEDFGDPVAGATWPRKTVLAK